MVLLRVMLLPLPSELQLPVVFFCQEYASVGVSPSASVAEPEQLSVESWNTLPPSLEVTVGPLTTGFVFVTVMVSSPLSVALPSEAITVQVTESPGRLFETVKVTESVLLVEVVVLSVVLPFFQV